MELPEFLVTVAMWNISIVSFVWLVKQIILLSYWVYQHELGRVEKND